MTTNFKHIMLIDDDPIVNLVNQALISSVAPAIPVSAFTSPEEALSKLVPASERTLLLLDLNMPRFDGWDFLNAFSQIPAPVRTQFCIYVLSSSIDDSDKQRACSHPDVKDYLVKPLFKPVLLSVLEQYEKQEVDRDQVAV